MHTRMHTRMHAYMRAADPDSYYSAAGPAGGGYLALNGSLSPTIAALVDHYKAKREPPSNIAVHARALREYVNELHDGLIHTYTYTHMHTHTHVL